MLTMRGRRPRASFSGNVRVRMRCPWASQTSLGATAIREAIHAGQTRDRCDFSRQGIDASDNVIAGISDPKIAVVVHSNALRTSEPGGLPHAILCPSDSAACKGCDIAVLPGPIWRMAWLLVSLT